MANVCVTGSHITELTSIFPHRSASEGQPVHPVPPFPVDGILSHLWYCGHPSVSVGQVPGTG